MNRDDISWILLPFTHQPIEDSGRRDQCEAPSLIEVLIFQYSVQFSFWDESSTGCPEDSITGFERPWRSPNNRSQLEKKGEKKKRHDTKIVTVHTYSLHPSFPGLPRVKTMCRLRLAKIECRQREKVLSVEAKDNRPTCWFWFRNLETTSESKDPRLLPLF
ncbi:hypothetical protein ACRALDRAFT_205051 [Sodiomyces alcalophilus JCM 7366]|uniref:uncharacterized protein n=1 Tax=Sodiomyces alcalophilus JCM 7366 TaxID=591952 RepID=UPI0039B533F3